MSRIRTAAIFGTLTLSVYFLVISIAAMLLGRSAVLTTLLAPLSLLDDLFNAAFDQFAFGRDLLSVATLWLTFVSLIDMSMIFSSIDVRPSLRSFAANSYTKRLLTGFRVTAG